MRPQHTLTLSNLAEPGSFDVEPGPDVKAAPCERAGDRPARCGRYLRPPSSLAPPAYEPDASLSRSAPTRHRQLATAGRADARRPRIPAAVFGLRCARQVRLRRHDVIEQSSPLDPLRYGLRSAAMGSRTESSGGMSVVRFGPSAARRRAFSPKVTEQSRGQRPDRALLRRAKNSNALRVLDSWVPPGPAVHGGAKKSTDSAATLKAFFGVVLATIMPAVLIQAALSVDESEVVDTTTACTALLDRRKWNTRLELANAIFEYLKIWHHRNRRHSQVGWLTPIEFERNRIITVA